MIVDWQVNIAQSLLTGASMRLPKNVSDVEVAVVGNGLVDTFYRYDLYGNTKVKAFESRVNLKLITAAKDPCFKGLLLFGEGGKWGKLWWAKYDGSMVFNDSYGLVAPSASGYKYKLDFFFGSFCGADSGPWCKHVAAGGIYVAAKGALWPSGENRLAKSFVKQADAAGKKRREKSKEKK